MPETKLADPIVNALREADHLLMKRVAEKVDSDSSKGLAGLLRAKLLIAEAELQILGGSD